MDPDGDAIRRSPPLGCVRVCVGAWEGKGEVSASVGRKGHRAGRVRPVHLFGFWLMLKNVKDPTDRHWNMIFFFFRETDRQDGKKDNLDAPTSSTLA